MEKDKYRFIKQAVVALAVRDYWEALFKSTKAGAPRQVARMFPKDYFTFFCNGCNNMCTPEQGEYIARKILKDFMRGSQNETLSRKWIYKP